MTKDAADVKAPTHATVKNEDFREADDSPPTSILVTDAAEDDDYDQDDDQDDCGEDKDNDVSDRNKKMKRILANRGSARASYQRRKKMIAELQASVTSQSIRNAAMEAENKLLRGEILELRQQVRELLLRQMPPRHPTNVGRPDTTLSAALGLGLCGSRPNVPPAHLFAHTMAAASHPSPSVADLMCLLSKKNLAGLLRGIPPPDAGMH
jgi:hypothetical protein